MREEALIRGRIAEDKTFTAPIYAAAGLLGLNRARTAGCLILALVLVLEPLSIGLAVATSAVWQKQNKKAETVLAQNAETAEILPEKMPEIGKTAKTAFSAKTANAEKSNSYPSQNCRKNAGNAETAKTAFPAIPAKAENAELHAVKEKFGLTEEKIAHITGRNKIETVLQWLNNEKEIPEKALRELRRWARYKNKVVALREA